MSELTSVRPITCPHCGEVIDVVLDLSVPEQSYVEDCSVCCRPILLTIDVADGENAEIGVEATE